MSSYSRRAICLAGLAGLAACGFRPVYGPGGAGGDGLQGAVRLDEPEGRDAFVFARATEERLGRGGPGARYALSYDIATETRSTAIASDNVTLRFNLLGQVSYGLRDTGTGTEVLSGRVENFNSYSASGSTVATEAARSDARERLMTILADQMVARILAAAPDLAQ